MRLKETYLCVLFPPTFQVHILWCSPQRCELIIWNRPRDGQEREDATSPVVDEHHREGGPCLACGWFELVGVWLELVGMGLHKLRLGGKRSERMLPPRLLMSTVRGALPRLRSVGVS